MNSQTLISRGRLEHVEALLRDVIARDFAGDAQVTHERTNERNTKGDAGALGRILVHIVNIHQSVSTSQDGHSNAAKRLGDFAVTMDRMASGKPESAQRLMRLAEALRAARSGMDDMSARLRP